MLQLKQGQKFLLVDDVDLAGRRRPYVVKGQVVTLTAAPGDDGEDYVRFEALCNDGRDELRVLNEVILTGGQFERLLERDEVRFVPGPADLEAIRARNARYTRHGYIEINAENCQEFGFRDARQFDRCAEAMWRGGDGRARASEKTGLRAKGVDRRGATSWVLFCWPAEEVTA